MTRKNDLTFKVTATDGDGKTIECVATPSMWALADEWIDELCANGAHTFEWRNARLANGFEYLALLREIGGKDEGGKDTNPDFPDMRIDGKPTLPAIAMMLDRYDVDFEPITSATTGEDDGEDGNPTKAGAEKDQAPA